ncbi:acyl-CoA thioester hydrolase/BAAT C-terminal domain-containing protein [Nigerium massiliense]|uniref:acyl-CoA thioester hydrolase/BAAT C-terminal domain-containing protein n=1 Tax=Nigerium massiliense TaxID=1522317 RepID=UPI0006944A50|nr:acyl-CoA thioester hydrolase/BAAT C-terminal domain-containing protein [Nigerium massiliense]
MADRRRIVKRLAIGCGGLLALVVNAAVVLMFFNPWAPKVTVTDPGQGGTRITENGLLGNYYPAVGAERRPGVLVFGGSEGGLSQGSDRIARTLSKEGFSALAISYWGGPGQNPRMEKVPLETFDTALGWLGRQPSVDPQRLGIMGASKGGEASLLVASRNPQVRAAVGYVPSSVVWQGFDQAQPWRMAFGMESTWSAGGQPVPPLPYSSRYRGGDLVDLYRMSLEDNLAAHPEAVIPVEKARGPLLLICGEKDTMWPSCAMSADVKKRATEHGHPAVTVLAYADAGHMIFGPPVPTNIEFYDKLGVLGGTPDANNAAAADSWPKVVTFLTRQLKS